MANIRPGISFYRTDSGHIRDPKIRLLRNEYGNDGYFIYSALIDKGHEEWGYYFDMNNEEEFELFADDLKMKTTLVREVITGCLRRGLFDNAVAEMSKVLTNEKMQEVFIYATAERRRKGSEFEINKEWLLYDLMKMKKIPENILIVHGKIGNLPVKSSQTKQKLKRKQTLKQNETKKIEGEAPLAPPLQNSNSDLEENKAKVQDARRKKVADNPPKLEEVKEYFAKLYNPKNPATWFPDKCDFEAREFYLHYKGNGWQQGSPGRPLYDWVSAAEKWISKAKKGGFNQPSAPTYQQPVVLPPPANKTFAPTTTLNATQRGINFLFEQFLVDNNSVTVISVDYMMYDEMNRAGKINLSEEEKTQIHEKAVQHYKAKNVEYDDKILLNLKKRMGVLEMFKKLETSGDKLIFEENK